MCHMVYFLSLQTNIIFHERKLYWYYCKTLLYLGFIYLYDNNLFAIYLTLMYIMLICEFLSCAYLSLFVSGLKFSSISDGNGQIKFVPMITIKCIKMLLYFFLNFAFCPNGIMFILCKTNRIKFMVIFTQSSVHICNSSNLGTVQTHLHHISPQNE